MVLHPEVMHKAQAEIDSVIGRERLPGFADKERLPYVSAIVKEILRWRPVAPLGTSSRSESKADNSYIAVFPAMPHRCTQASLSLLVFLGYPRADINSRTIGITVISSPKVCRSFGSSFRLLTIALYHTGAIVLTNVWYVHSLFNIVPSYKPHPGR